MTADIVRFLRARWDGLEKTARCRLADYAQYGQYELDPDDVLADLESKRRILDEYEKALDRRRRHPDDLASAGALLQMVSVVKLLALPFATHPDYRDEWRPQP